MQCPSEPSPPTNRTDCVYKSCSLEESKDNHDYLSNLTTNGVSCSSAARMFTGSVPKRNINLSRNQVHYLSHQYPRENKEYLDSSTKLIEHLKGIKNIPMSVLFHEVDCDELSPAKDNRFIVSNYSNISTSSHDDSSVHYSSSLIGEDYRDLMETRMCGNIPSSKKMTVTVAWVMRTDRKYFDLYLEVIMIDVTENTNNEKRPMLLVVCKDADGKTFVVMRVFMPHQRKWIFKWIFSFCFRTLLGEKLQTN